MTFIAWLKEQQEREDCVGEFARYYFSVPGTYRPRGRVSREGMLDWVNRQGGLKKWARRGAVYIAWKEWRENQR